MLTIFSSPKPFTGETAWNQLNAMRSWRAIHQDVEIIIYGAPPGAAEAATDVNALLIPKVECSSTGAPSFNEMAEHARQYGRYDQQVYINADILLNVSLLKAMEAARHRFDQFLLVGERIDLAQGSIVDASQSDWTDSLTTLVKLGQLTAHGPTGADYFGFIRGMWKDLPPVFMGRAMCDQALLHYCLNQRIPIIDCTMFIVAVHQFHGYQHARGGVREVFDGKDRALMAQAHGMSHSLPTVVDADRQFTGDGSIVPGRRHILRRIELTLRYHYGLRRVSLALRALQYLGGRRVMQPKKTTVNDILKSWQ